MPDEGHDCPRTGMQSLPPDSEMRYSMQLKLAGKADLKDLYLEIAFFDRKIAYCRNYEKFDSEDARSVSLQKLVTKRQTLVCNAKSLSDRGIECDVKYVPESLKQPGMAGKGGE